LGFEIGRRMRMGRLSVEFGLHMEIFVGFCLLFFVENFEMESGYLKKKFLVIKLFFGV